MSKVWLYVASGLIGFGVGWLVGLSASSVLGIVLTGTIGGIAAVVLTASGLKGSQELVGVLDAWPVALMVLGIMVGSSLAVYARSHDLLGLDDEEAYWNAVHRTVTEWSELTGLSPTVIASQLLANPDLVGGMAGSSGIGKPNDGAIAYIVPPVFPSGNEAGYSGALTSASVEVCDELRAVINTSELRSTLNDFPELRVLGEIPDEDGLNKFIGEVLCAPKDQQ